MGYNRETMTISARLSSHNSDQDDIDRTNWLRFGEEVRKLAAKPEYADLIVDVSGAEE